MGKMKSQHLGESDQNSRADRGNCQICVDPKLLEKEENEIQERHKKVYQEMQGKFETLEDKELLKNKN